jgi:hypothetical protein
MRLNISIHIPSILPLTLCLSASCGTANLNRIFLSKDDSAAANLQRAQMAYDRADFDEAEEYATKAYESTTDNGDAAVLLGNVMLSKSGIDIFQLIGKLSELSNTSTTTSTTSTSSTTCAKSSSDAAGSLSQLSCLLLNLTTDDIAALGSDVKLTSDGLKGLGSYYKPTEVSDELREKVSVLKYANKGIKYLCPFVNRAVVFSGSIDTRHELANCGDKSGTAFNSGKVHISFALLHLVETLVYQRGVLVDGTAGSGKVGISTLSTSLNTASFSSISSFTSTIKEFKTVVDALADTANNKSQIALALDGLLVVANSFTAAGVPSEVTSVITSGLTKLKETASKLASAAGSSSSSANYQAQALKGQINEQYAKQIASKIDSVCGSNSSTCASQKTELCSSYTSISQGVDPSKVTTPSICN